MFFLDQGYTPTAVSQSMRERIAALPRTDHDRIIFHVHGLLLKSPEAPIGRPLCGSAQFL
jgi:hypothetical protein